MVSPVPRAERRRLEREARKNGGDIHDAKKLPKTSPYRLYGALISLIFVCGCLALTYGGGLWVDLATWITIVGALGIVAAAISGFIGWKRWRHTFAMSKRKFGMITLILITGVSLSYGYSQAIRTIGTTIEFKNLKKENQGIIDLTGSWKGESWKNSNCNVFERSAKNLESDVLNGAFPPTGDELRLLFAVDSVGYRAGCNVNFIEQATALVDDNHRWTKSAPWQYSTIRRWLNEGGWPRIGEGCSWEMERERVAGRNDIAELLKPMCKKHGLEALSSWNPGALTKMAQARRKQQEIVEAAAADAEKLKKED